MTLLHGIGLLTLGSILSIGVFWLISIAERESTVEKRRTALDDFNRRQNS